MLAEAPPLFSYRLVGFFFLGRRGQMWWKFFFVLGGDAVLMEGRVVRVDWDAREKGWLVCARGVFVQFC